MKLAAGGDCVIRCAGSSEPNKVFKKQWSNGMFNKKEDLTSTFLLIMCLKLMQLRYIWEQGEGRSYILPDFKMLDADSTNPAKGSSLSLDCWRYIFNFLPAPHVQGQGERKGNSLQDREEEKVSCPRILWALKL